MVAMPKPKAVALLPRLRRADQIDAAQAEIQGMIARGEAELVAYPEVVTCSGQRATVEDIQEVRYATNVQAPPADAASQKGDGKGPPSFTYETRNTGVTLEVDPTVTADGKSVNLTLVPQRVTLMGWQDAFIVHNPNGTTTAIQQPVFSTLKVTTSVSLRSGESYFLSSFQVPKNDQQLEFFILRVEILGKGAQEPVAK